MSRTIFLVAGVFSVPSLLLVDSAIKATALLLLAVVAAVILRRDSAATRHLVWLLAIVAMLAVPVLSAMLPQWRVLPEWAGISPKPVVVEISPPPITRPADGAVELPQNAQPVEVEPRSASAHQPAAVLPDSRPALVTPEAIPASTVRSWNWLNVLPLVWAIGFCVLILRLLASRWMLWNTERQGTAIWSSAVGHVSQRARVDKEGVDEKTAGTLETCPTPHDTIVTALESACLQLGIARPVTLLIHPDETIPVVWGILRYRLLLPATARHWSGEQLRSVLLHELAHIQRRDTIAQLLAQIACALHWFNPLAWFAAWRLGVERERACDDLVLASGVQPSAYAGHLLNVVTRLSPARWTESCGLAMARKSSLEGRLVAVLSKNLNRRSVSVALAAIALAIAVGIAVPLAMLRAADEKTPAPVPQESVQQNVAQAKPAQEKPVPRAGLPQPKEGAKLDRATLQGVWMGEKDGINVEVKFLWHSESQQVEWELKTSAGSRIGAQMSVVIEPDGKEAKFVFRKGLKFEATQGRVTPDQAGTLRLEVIPNPNITDGGYPAVKGIVLTRQPNADAKPQSGTAKPQRDEPATGGPQPKQKNAQALFNTWKEGARADGKIPGGALGPLSRTVANFIRLNPTHEAAPKLAELRPRIDLSHDWTQTDAVALLDDVTAIYATLPDWVMGEDRFLLGRYIRKGQPLPAELANAPWGTAQPSGLRVAWLLEPQAAEHRLGTPLRSRILFHNAGKDSVVFRALTWNQSGAHKAQDAKGAEININSTFWTTLPEVVPCRLAPGEFIEMTAAGIVVGSRGNEEDWQGIRVGSWIDPKAGDEVTFTPAPVAANGDRNEAQPDGGPGWWLEFIKTRLSLDAPVPADAADRTRLLNRAVRELFGTAPTAEETAMFLADREPTALDSLAKRLAKRAGLTSYTGMLQSGPTKFRVLPADPDAAKRPRVAGNPGRYTLGENIRLVVSRRPEGTRTVNEASIVFFSTDSTKPPPGEPYKLNLPDGYSTWAAAWLRDLKVLWVMQKGIVRKYDFANPAEVKVTTLEGPASLEKVPRAILDALRGALKPEAPKPAKESPKPAKEGANAGSPPGEIVVITRDSPRPFVKLDAGGGITLEIAGRIFHGADVITTVRIRCPAGAGQPALGHDEYIAMDAFGNRERWAFGWVRGTKTFWYLNTGIDGHSQRLRRVTFDDPQRITSDYQHLYQGEPLDGLGIPAQLQKQFEKFCGITQSKVLDKSGGLPEINGRFVHAAQPVSANGDVPQKVAAPSPPAKRWKVQFVDGDTGRPAPGLRMRLRVHTADGSHTYDVTRFVHGNDSLEPTLDAAAFGEVSIVDGKFTDGDAPIRYFGNVPDSVSTVDKHTDPNKPFLVKVWPRAKQANARPAGAKLPDDALWDTKVPFEKIPVEITNWSAEKNGLRIGMRVTADEGWRLGGKVKVEMWLHNPGAKNISFTAVPGRSDVGLSVAAKDSEGEDHWAENGNVMIIAIPEHCVLPAGHVAKVKDFALSFDAPGNTEQAWFAPKFRKLKPGSYKLRCVWADAHPSVSGKGAWTGELVTGEVDFLLAEATRAGHSERF